MAEIFSPHHQARVWRDLWIALAETERELGVDIPAEAVDAMRAARDSIDLARVAEHERELRHDVMSHVMHFGEVAPAARGFIHLGATSAFVADNTALIQHRDALALVRRRLLGVVRALRDFAHKHRALPTLGYTHLQPAQPTTVGKRATLWLQDFVADVEAVETVSAALRLRGARGTTGTEATFLELFDGDGAKVERLNARLAGRFCFSGVYPVVGQTYPRKVDQACLAALSGVGASAARFGYDVRLLQSFGELEEPFGERQIGSSAMPYKRNPMRSERICSLARHLCALELDAAWTASVQSLERTLDDSAVRRVAIPEAYLAADAILQLVLNVVRGLVLHPRVIENRLRRELPFLATEDILIAGVRGGGDRQTLHERIRRHAMAARDRLDEGAPDNDFLHRVAEDDEIGLDAKRLEQLVAPKRLIGRAPEQVDRYLEEVVDPMLAERVADVIDTEEIRV